MAFILGGNHLPGQPQEQKRNQNQNSFSDIRSLPCLSKKAEDTPKINCQKHKQEGHHPDGILPCIKKTHRSKGRCQHPERLLFQRLFPPKVKGQKTAEDQKHLDIGNAVPIHPLKSLHRIRNRIPQQRQVQKAHGPGLLQKRTQAIDKKHTAYGIAQGGYIQIGQVKKIAQGQI